MISNISAVFFDLDGTLIDSMWMWKAIDIEYLSTHHCDMPDDLQLAIDGMSFYETAVYFKNRFKINDSLEKIMSDWNEMAYDKYCNSVPLKKNAMKFLNILKENNIKLGIATSNSSILTEAVLKSHGIYDYFDSIVTGNDKGPGKPDPFVYLKSSSNVACNPANCLVFEDLVAGIKAGKAAGMKVCAVEDSNSAHEFEMKKALADYYISDYGQIINKTYEVLA